MTDLIKNVEKHFNKLWKESTGEYFWLPRHIPSVVKMAEKICTLKPEADEDVVLLGAWLHDIGILTEGIDTDHAVSGEKETIRFLTEVGANQELINKVAHCVRAHRNRDVTPNTLEAKIIATADSASHLIEPTYADFASRGDLQEGLEKLERDYRDIGLIPEVKEELEELYQAWKQLLEVFPKD